MKTNVHDIWDYINSVSGKTCAINCYSVTYAQARCAVVCFKSAEFLDAVINTTPVLRGVNLHWSHLSFSKCVECEKTGYTSLSCFVGGNFFSGKSSYKALLDVDKNRLAIIYAKHLASVACPVAFGGVS
ncbi:hypothetical protein G9A89_013511 [Geosiphon pyriformis]|nr:hypothetical protein G9A89_013511 [Geosiphon pyriformis]